ncbi:cytochrome P450 81E8-like [Coffea eugenioides]|uniref:cytochrome P450 81E8-like n=1 Tax=Coffea eugenioides TaxID=49369 RepID=UPI000F611B3C|nr:cytochrome P450 81E8-like [Coffea eugenioides]
MEQNLLSNIAILFLTLILPLLLLHKKRQKKSLPSSPPSLPILGHLHLLKPPLHKTFKHLSDKYGPIFSLRFGNQLAVITSSPAIVEECLTKNGIVFANRPSGLGSKYLNYDGTTIATAPYGPLWKRLRRISTMELFSGTRLNMFSANRQDETKLLVKNLYKKSSQNFARVEIRSQMMEMTINNIMTMFSGKRYYGYEVEDNKEALQFRDIVREMFELAILSPVDYFPILRWFGYQNLENRMIAFQKKSDEFLQRLLDEQRTSPTGDGRRTIMEILQSMQELEPEFFSDDIIKGFVLILLAAGSETSSSTIEWTMSLLLNHPKELERARAELDKNIGQNRLVEEEDLPKLPYLQSIIYESQRLLPATPILLPRASSSDCTIGNYTIPSTTILIVNAWAIHRDPQLWDDPESFKPERFLGLENDAYKHKFIPFGLGRRKCPGAGLANRLVGLTLGSLIQCFEWERISNELVDLSEGTGITMSKASPLEAICKPRESMVKFLAGI